MINDIMLKELINRLTKDQKLVVSKLIKKTNPELMGMTDKEMIRHTCREAISSNKLDFNLKLKASNLLLSFVDKTGTLNELTKDARTRFRSMDIKDIAMILDTKQKDISPKPDLKESEEVAING